MKMHANHYQYLKNEIAKLPRNWVAEHKAQGLGINKDVRFRWDLMRAAKVSTWISDNLYSYLDDDHIDTGLKHIVKELKL